MANGLTAIQIGNDVFPIDFSQHDHDDRYPIISGDGENSAVQKGSNNVASGTFSVALGADNVFGNIDSVPAGDKLEYAKATGYASHAEGAAHALGDYSHAEGGGNTDLSASGFKVVSTAEGECSHAEGSHTHAKAGSSHAEGNRSKAYGIASHAEGRESLAEGLASHAEGFNTKTGGTAVQNNREVGTSTDSGAYAHAEGNATIAKGIGSHSEGRKTIAIGNAAHAEGQDTAAEGYRSHAEGKSTKAIGRSSHVEGEYTIANNIAEHASGKYNVSNSDTQFSIGIGTSNTNRKNAFEVKQNGDIYIEGVYGRIQDRLNIDLLVPIVYNDLKKLRYQNKLIPGQQYRITDYITSTTQSNTISANHQFDIIVTADSENSLNEKARACLHNDDTYFANSDLNTWEIWYCLDNDTNRFNWANTSNENTTSNVSKKISTINSSSFSGATLTSAGQTITFDKPISHIVFKDTTYTLSQMQGSSGVPISSSPPIAVRANSETSLFIYFGTSSSLSTAFFDSYPIEVYTEESIIRYVGKGVIYRMIDERGNDCPYDFKNIMFKHPDENKIETYPDYYYTFTVLNSGVISDHSLNSCCYNNVMKEHVTLIASGTYGSSLNNNIFINSTPTSYCYKNSFGGSCNYNSFGDSCYINSFGDSFNYNSFGNGCSYNSFGDSCSDNEFGDSYRRNNFGDSCSENSFGDSCSENSFGDSCSENSFGNNCNNNYFGNYCNNNYFGNYCYNNSFGNNCNSNSFRTSANERGDLLNYCRYNTFDDGCKQIVIHNTVATNSSNYLQNIKVDKSASTTGSSYVYYNIGITNSASPIFISNEYNSTTISSSIPIGLYNGSAINNKVYTGYVTVTPSRSCINAAGGFYETSDERLKNFSDDVMIDLEKLSSLRKKYFTWKDGHGDQQLGVSAQEVQVLYPELVNEGDDGNLSVDYAKLSVVALSAIDKLYNKQKDLEDKLAKIEKALNL